MGDADLILPEPEITVKYEPGTSADVPMADGSVVRFRKVPEGFDPTDRDRAYAYVREHQEAGEVLTGLLHLDPTAPEMHAASGTVPGPLVDLPYHSLCPGASALDRLQDRFR